MTLDELQKICDEATPGPWRIGDRGLWEDAKVLNASGELLFYLHMQADANFIAAAREWMPKLIEENRKLKIAVGILTENIGESIFSECELSKGNNK